MTVELRIKRTTNRFSQEYVEVHEIAQEIAFLGNLFPPFRPALYGSPFSRAIDRAVVQMWDLGMLPEVEYSLCIKV
jgi:hypothetical protein